MEFGLAQIGAVTFEGYWEDDIFMRIRQSGRFFEQEILERWEPWYREAEVILDAGANLGNHSIYWAVHTSAGKIVAFEPYEANFELLKRNIARNTAGQVVCEQKAAGSRSGQVRLAAPVERSSLGNASFCYCENEEMTEDAVAEAVSLDDYVREAGLGQVDFVKIDTEGFELEVLRGMDSLLYQFSPAVWVETEESHAAETVRYMERHGYFLADVQRMNCLFLHPRKFPDARPMETGKMLAALLEASERAVINEIRYEELKHRRLL